MAETPHASLRRRVALIAAIVLAVALPLVVRSLVDGRSELARGVAAEASGELDAAIVHYGRAARWRLPLAGHDEQARAALAALAESAEAEDRHALALDGWRELRASLLGTRGLSLAESDQLARANEGIVRNMLATADPPALAGDPREAMWREQLERPPATDTARTRAAALVFSVWLVGVFGFGVWGIGHGRRRILAAGAGLVALLVAWIALM